MRIRFASVCALMVAILTCSGGAAHAFILSKAKANIEQGNVTCGENQPSDPVLGTVTFKAAGKVDPGEDNVLLTVTIKHGEPNSFYSVKIRLVEPAGGCPVVGNGGSVTTNSKGRGKASFLVEHVVSEFTGQMFAGIESMTKEVDNTPAVPIF
jgi:hypothetical protein